MKRFEEQNYYEILEVAFDASSNEIDRAYRNALATYNQGSLLTYSLFTSEERDAILKKLEDAYNTLIDDRSRQTYNESLKLYQINSNKPNDVNIDTIKFFKDRQDMAHLQISTNKYHPSVVAQTSDNEVGTNLLQNPVYNSESRFMKKHLRQFLYPAAAIPVLLLLLSFVSYGAVTSWNFLKQVYSTRSDSRPQINGKASQSSVRARIPEQEKHALAEERDYLQEKHTGKVEPEALQDETSKVYLNLASVANIRLNPDINSRIIMKIRHGKDLNVIGRTDKWLMLKLEDGAIGWIHHSLAHKKDLNITTSMVE